MSLKKVKQMLQWKKQSYGVVKISNSGNQKHFN